MNPVPLKVNEGFIQSGSCNANILVFYWLLCYWKLFNRGNNGSRFLLSLLLLKVVGKMGTVEVSLSGPSCICIACVVSDVGYLIFLLKQQRCFVCMEYGVWSVMELRVT